MALSLGFLVSFAMAQPVARVQGLSFDAQEFERDNETDTIDLKGHVQVISEDRHIQADRAHVNLKANQIELEGHVKITSLKSTLGGDRIILDYESGTGVIYNGYVQSGQVMFEGSVIQKTGPEEFFVVDADYTACTNCPASWSFGGSSIRAELGGYAYIKNPIFKIGPVPILPLPYLVVPLKSDRQSGLLAPGFEQSQVGGVAVSLPYFYVISRSSDATLTLKNYELRGFKGLINYRYVLDQSSSGELDAGAIKDRVFQNEDRLNKWRPADGQGDPVNRWFIKYKHYQELPDGWVHRAVVNNASDLQYPRDFTNETLNHGDASMETRLSMTKNTFNSHFDVDASYYTNLLQGDPLAGNDEAVHRLPEIHYVELQKPIGKSGFFYTYDLDYTNFARSGPGYDDLDSYTYNGSNVRVIKSTCSGAHGDPATGYGTDPQCKRIYDGRYDEGIDLIRTGQRFDFQPTLLYPVPLGGVADLLTKISYRETHYNFTVGDETNNVRRYVRGEVGGRMRFSRVYGDLSDPKSTRYKHEIRPELTYTALPWIDHKSHPFFGFTAQTEAPTFSSQSVSDEDLFGSSGLQFDSRDRLYDRNLLTYSLVNTITRKKWVNESPSYEQIALIKLSQSYDRWKDTQNQYPYSDISLQTDLRFDHLQTYNEFNYFPYQRVTNTAMQIRVNDDAGKFAQLKVSEAFTIVPNQAADISKRTQDYTLATGFISRYLNLMGQFTYDANTDDTSKKIKSWGYIAQFKPAGDCWVINFIHGRATEGDTNFRLDFGFTFDGVPKPPLPPEELRQFEF